MLFRKGKLNHPFQYLSRIIRVFLLGAVVLSIVFIINQFSLSDSFPIRKVLVYGVNHVDQEEIKTMITPLVNTGYFNINIDNIRDRLTQIPWIAEITVRRDWPDQILITMTEKNPIAKWNESHLLSGNGEIFLPKELSDSQKLPHFFGPEGKQMIMLQYFDDINRILQPLHAKIFHLELTPYSTWRLTLDNGIRLQMGNKDILTRLGQFVKVYPKIIGARLLDIDYIDLRYSNGVAVRWKTPT
jgi:cell division protein FtsQ